MFLTIFSCAMGQTKFAEVFSDNMVLQQESNIILWGTANPSTNLKVVCSWSQNVKYTMRSNFEGMWEVEIETPKADGKQYQVTLSSDKDSVVLNNVLLGEVWLCSGQSNMEMVLKNQPQWNLIVEGSEEEIAEANFPMLRFINIGRKESFEPLSNIVTEGWKIFTPDDVQWLSAIGYFFAKEIGKELNIPIGIIVSAYGGSPIQSWLPLQTIGAKSIYANVRDERQEEQSVEKQSDQEYVDKMLRWVEESEKKQSSTHRIDDVVLPANLEQISIGNHLGEILFSKQITLEQIDRDLKVSLGTIDDFGSVFFNGENVWSEMRNSKSYRKIEFSIPSTSLIKGTNTIEVRVLNVLWGGGLTGPASDMFYQQEGGDQLSLSGMWQCKKIFDLKEVKPIPREGKPLFSTASALYNGMIYPLSKYKIRGILWYQGESNLDESAIYTEMSEDLIASWRDHFGLEVPFYYVQIAPYSYGDPMGTKLSALRVAQERILHTTPNAAMAITIDLGDPNNIHPAKKRDVAKRLSAIALNETYKKDLSIAHPLLKSIEKQENSVILSFSNVGDGLKQHGDNSPFELSSDGKNFIQANVVIVGNDKISLDGIRNPTHVRYSQRNSDIGVVFNSEGMPLNAFSVKIE